MAKKDNSRRLGDEGLPDFSIPVEQADVVTLPPAPTNGYGDADLDGLERLEELSLPPEPAADEGTPGTDAALAVLEERTERLSEVVRRQHAARVHRKVTAAVAGGGIVGAIPAILEAVDGLNLPGSVQPFVVLAAALVGLFTAAYATPEREAPHRRDAPGLVAHSRASSKRRGDSIHTPTKGDRNGT